MPLIYDMENEANQQVEEKIYLGSYVGRPTHKLRIKLESKQSNNRFYVKNLDSMNSEISKENQLLFKQIMSKSYFSICPRGYGPTSFRLYESIQAGIVPVYISDSHFIPFADKVNWDDFSIIMKPREMNKLSKILEKSLENGNHLILDKNLQLIGEQYFNFSYMCKYILSKVT